jgi:hypothetical protein
MAARLNRPDGRGGSWRALAALLASALLVSCAGGSPPAPRPDPGGGGPPLPSAQRSFSPQVATTVAALRSALEAQGLRLLDTARPFRPAEPAALTSVGRAVVQVDLGDPEAGQVVIYDLADPAAAATAGQTLAGFLASGPGQANYPLDARFSVSQLAGTLVFAWWSPERADDPERTRQAFEIVSGVGQPIPVAR